MQRAVLADDDSSGHYDHNNDADEDHNDNEDVQDWCSVQCWLMMIMAMMIIISVTRQENKMNLEYTLDRPGPAPHVFLVVAFLCQNTVVIC